MIFEAVLGQVTSVDFGNVQIDNVRPLEFGEKSRVIELCWPSYIAYAVRNESYWDKEDGEPEFNNHLYMRSSSAFLECVKATTFATDDYPGPFQHWGLDTLNHCVAVVSVDAPRIRQLPSGEIGQPSNSLNFVKG